MRIRTIKPEFWANEKMARMPDFTRLLAIGLLNYADDHGYFWANPLMIRGALFPFDEDSSKVRRGLAQLQSEGFIRLGKTADDREAGHIVKFAKHQRIDRARDSDIQHLVTFDEASTNDRRSLDDDSLLDRKGSGIGTGKGRDDGLEPLLLIEKPIHQLRAEGLFNRKTTTQLSASEERAWKRASKLVAETDDEGWEMLEWWFSQPSGELTKYRRTDLAALLNNWHAEIEKARRNRETPPEKAKNWNS